MAGTIEARLEELGIILPEAAAPVANYVPWVLSGRQVFVSGQVAIEAGALKYRGKVGKDLSLEDGRAAARLCALNLIAQAKVACGGDLDRIGRVLKIGVFVSSAPDFTDQPKVANGASDLMVDVFGDAGTHARFAVGVSVLPLDSAVEVEGIFELE